jgi:hypothetical protein
VGQAAVSVAAAREAPTSLAPPVPVSGPLCDDGTALFRLLRQEVDFKAISGICATIFQLFCRICIITRIAFNCSADVTIMSILWRLRVR